MNFLIFVIVFLKHVNKTGYRTSVLLLVVAYTEVEHFPAFTQFCPFYTFKNCMYLIC